MVNVYLCGHQCCGTFMSSPVSFHSIIVLCLSVSSSVCLSLCLLLITNCSVNGRWRRQGARLSRANTRPPCLPHAQTDHHWPTCMCVCVVISVWCSEVVGVTSRHPCVAGYQSAAAAARCQMSVERCAAASSGMRWPLRSVRGQWMPGGVPPALEPRSCYHIRLWCAAAYPLFCSHCRSRVNL